MDCCARRILSIQPDFFTEESAIEKGIMGINNTLTGHKVMYYSKFYCELNHIEYF